MAGIPEALELVRSALLAALDQRAPQGLGDDELLLVTAALEAVGRVVDAHRAGVAGEIDERSRIELGSERLSARKGCRSAAELVERVTQVSGSEARRRISVGAAIRPRVSFTGQPQDPVYRHLAAGVAAGEVGLDAAATIVRELGRARTVADPVAADAAEHA
ncbi:hypothetical protein VPH61_12150, partial [Agromyces sp. CCNWLW203]